MNPFLVERHFSRLLTFILVVMSSFFAGPQLSKPHNKKRALLDTNIWRYVVDENGQGEMFRLSRKGAYKIQAAPAVLFEILRMSDASLRSALVRLITNHRFARLMLEAYSESMEILREIGRVRPDWLRANPNTVFFDRLKKDWSRKTGGLWLDYSRFSDQAAQIRQTQDYEMVEGGRRETQNARKEMLGIGWKRNPPMDKTLAGFKEPVPGWRGDMVEAWRIDSVVGLTYNLRRTGCPYRDWIAPFVELDNGLLYSAEWVEFWLYQARREALPRQWIRWAHSFAQRFRKTTPGTLETRNYPRISSIRTSSLRRIRR
jgi:hypothetical protein